MRQSIKLLGWKEWIDQHPSPQYGWGGAEFDILAQVNAPVTLLSRIYGRDRRTIEKYLLHWKEDKEKNLHAES